MTVYWLCRTCGASGEGDRPAEQHVRETAHTTETFTKPRRVVAEERQAVRYWLTPAAYAVIARTEARS